LEYRVKNFGNYFEIKISGPAKLEIYAEFLDAVLEHEEWRPGSPLLVDETDLDTSPLTIGEVQEIAEMCAQRSAKIGKSKCALVVSRNLEFGMVRMWGAFVDGKWDVQPNLFRSRDEAIAWLAE
jgi:hypothetical protein